MHIPPWAYHDLIVGLTDQVLSHVDGGAIRDPCGSRVLESALLLRLVDRSRFSGRQRHNLVSYLRAAVADGSRFDRVLARVALGAPADADLVVGEVLARAPRAVLGRKQFLVASVLSLFGPTGPRPVPDPEQWCEGLHTWASIEMLAAKAIAICEGLMGGEMASADWAHLVDSQRGDDVWEGNLLVHLLVLHALAYLPSCRQLVTTGVAKALRHQRADGGIPFVANTDIWCTVTGGLALLCAGAATHAQLRPLGDFLSCQQHPDGLWAYSEVTGQTDLDDSAVCLEFLHGLDPHRYSLQLRRGLAAVRSYQNPDGGFPTYVKGAPSEPYITAAAVNGLSLAQSRYRDHMADAMRFLADRQLADGTFEPDWSRCRLHAVFRVLLAVSRFPTGYLGTAVATMERRALEAVMDARNADGGWGQESGDPSDATSTSYALAALAGYDQVPLVAAGVQFLRRAFRGTEGGMVAPPDMVGPRPFVIDVPIFPNIYALLALGHIRSSVSVAAACRGERSRQTTSAGRGS